MARRASSAPHRAVLALPADRHQYLQGRPNAAAGRRRSENGLTGRTVAAAGAGLYFFFACRADHSAAMRRRNALGFSANSLPASRAAVFKCAARRASITGASRERHNASG